MTQPLLVPDLTDVAESDAWWASCAYAVLAELARTRREFTAEDFALLAPEVDHPNRIGALFSTAARRGLIRCVGFRPSLTPSRRGGVVRVWSSSLTRGEAGSE